MPLGRPAANFMPSNGSGELKNAVVASGLLFLFLIPVPAQPETAVEERIRLGQYFLGHNAAGRAVSEFESAVRMSPIHPVAHYNLGVALRLWGDLKGSEAALRKALKLQPRFPDAHFELGLVLGDRIGSEHEGKEEFEAAVEQNPDFADAHFNLGVIHWKENNVPLALSAFKKAVQLQPKSPEYRFRLGQALAQTGILHEAARELERAVELEPAHAKARYQLATLMQRVNEPARAATHWDILRRIQSQGPRAVEKDQGHLAYQDGLTALERGNTAEAITKLTRGLATAGNEIAVRNALGIAYQRNREFERAEYQFRRVLEIDSNSPDVHINLGTLLGQRGDPAGAEREFRLCMAADPNFAEAHYNLGLVLAAGKRFAEAEAALRAAIALRPNHARARWNLARVLRDSGAPGAVEAFREACARDSSLTVAFLEWGKLLQSIDRPEEAIGVWSTALQREPLDPALHHLLMNALEKSGRHDQARGQRATYELLAASPDYRAGVTSLARGEFAAAAQAFGKLLRRHAHLSAVRRKLAFALFAQSDYTAAAAEYQPLLRDFPSDSDLHLNLGWALLQTNRTGEARKNLEQAVRLNPYAAQAHFQLGMTYVAEADLSRAMPHFHAARRLDPDVRLPKQQ